MFPPIPSPIVRHVIYPVYRGLRGDRVLDMLDEMEHVQFLPAGEIEDVKWRKMRRLLEEAAEHVPYYRELFAERGIDPAAAADPEGFTRIPELTWETVRKEGRRMVTRDPMRSGFRTVTAGSTREPLNFWCDVAAGPVRRANTLRGYRWTGFDIGDRQVLLREARPGMSPGGRVGWRLKNYLSNMLCLSPFEMDPASMRRHASRIRAWRPRLVAGHPSALAVFSEFCEREDLALHGPLAVVTSGEMLLLRQREVIERVFSAQVFHRYGSGELADVAMECEEHRGLHVFDDLFHAEVIHSSGRPARSGEAGELVITDLSNLYMPLIRYRTGDLAVSAGRQCPCGRGLSLLEKIEGRASSVDRFEGSSPARSSAGERLVIKSKIHKAHISGEDRGRVDCLRIDPQLMELGDIAEWEKILIVNATNGARLETFAVGAGESGLIEACGAVSRHCRTGDEISIMAFTWSSGPESGFSNILVDGENRFVRRLTERAGERI